MRKLKDQTELSGIFGEQVTVRKVNGRIVVTNRPKRKRTGPLTEKVLAQRERFQDAVAYAKKQAADEQSRALYAKAIKGKFGSVYSVALADYINVPVVRLIDSSGYEGNVGNTLLIEAKDDFMVTKVHVMVTGPDGVVIEQGAAVPDAERICGWRYVTTVPNATVKGTKITAIAYDRPGNQGTGEVLL
jgi:hypothetical protein